MSGSNLLEKQEKNTKHKSQDTERKSQVPKEKHKSKHKTKNEKNKIGEQSTAFDHIKMSQFEVSPTEFNAQSYMNRVFECEDVETVRDLLKEKLLEIKENATTHLQNVVHKNYQTFITTSKEILSLESEMLKLRNQLNELNSTIQSLNQISFHFDKNALPSRQKRSTLMGESDVIKDIDWFLELPNELEIMTNERRFSDAVVLIQKLEERFKTTPNLQSLLSSIEKELTKNIQNLVDQICKEFSNPSLKNYEIQTLVKYLSQLGYESRAKELFLETRSLQLRNEIRKLRYEGDVLMYVTELSRVVFTEIENTCENFRMCFTDSSSNSLLVVWIVKSLEIFTSIFRRQVFSNELTNFPQIEKCLNIAYSHCKLLEKKGLALNFFLQRTFQRDLITVINNFHSQNETNLNKLLTEEKWEQRQFNTGESSFMLTESAIFLFTLLQKFVWDILNITSPELLPKIVSIISKLIEKYLFELSQILENKISQLTDKQCLAILNDSLQVTNELLRRIVFQIEGKLQRRVVELNNLQERAAILNADIYKFYSTFRANDILNNILNWHSSSYSKDTFDELTASPSQSFIQMFEYLYKLANDINNTISHQAVKEIIEDILEQIATGLLDGHFWDNEKNREKSMFGNCGINQLVLDLKFCLEALGNFGTEKTKNSLKNVIERSLLHHCLATRVDDPSKFLKNERWYQSMIRDTLSTINTLHSVHF